MLVASLKRFMGAGTIQDLCPAQDRVEQWLPIDMSSNVRKLRPLFVAIDYSVDAILDVTVRQRI